MNKIISALIALAIGTWTNIGSFYYFSLHGLTIIETLFISGITGSAAAASFMIKAQRVRH